MATTPQKYVYIKTFGCQMNEHDSERMSMLLARDGYTLTSEPEGADLILFNTCTVREKAHHKAMSEIGHARLFKNNRKGVLVGVCGCVAEQEKESLFERYPHIDIVFGPDQIKRLPELLIEAQNCGKASALELIDDPSAYRFLGSDLRGTRDEGRGTSFVSITKGCDCACSYCIVPAVRGRQVCRPSDEIMGEVARLAHAGVREVVLLGQNVNAYKTDVRFAQLIRRIARETGISRIRFTSPHPRDVGDDLIREYGENEKLMPHIHLPVQSGANATLARMHRGYTRERYLEIVAALRAVRTGISITTDIIVGFCNEGEEEHKETLDLMRNVGFDSVFAFKYSPRPGTWAALKFADDVPPQEKSRRLEEVLELERRISKKHNESQLGKKSEALATGQDRMKSGRLTGRLPDNRVVHFTGNLGLIGHIVPVRITKANINSLIGEISEPLIKWFS